MLNLDSRQAATGQVAAESTKALLEALGLPATPEILAAAAGAAAAYIGGKRVIAGLSENGKPKPKPKPEKTTPEPKKLGSLGADADSEAGQPYNHPNKEFVVPKSNWDLTEGRAGHILANHRSGAGKANKTEFPKYWDDKK